MARPVLPRLREAGYRAALVAQDGMTELPAPDEWDVLFVGGHDAVEALRDGLPPAAGGRALGKWTHMGRVNSWRRLRAAARAGTPARTGRASPLIRRTT